MPGLGGLSMSELWGPGEQFGLLVGGVCVGWTWVGLLAKRQNSLPLPWRGEPDPVALCRSGSHLGRAGTWQPFSVASLSLRDQLDSGEWEVSESPVTGNLLKVSSGGRSCEQAGHPGPVHISGVEATCGLLWGTWTGGTCKAACRILSTLTLVGGMLAFIPVHPPPPEERPCCSVGGAERLRAASLLRAQSTGSMCGPQLQGPLRMPCCWGAPPHPSPTPTP